MRSCGFCKNCCHLLSLTSGSYLSSSWHASSSCGSITACFFFLSEHPRLACLRPGRRGQGCCQPCCQQGQAAVEGAEDHASIATATPVFAAGILIYALVRWRIKLAEPRSGCTGSRTRTCFMPPDGSVTISCSALEGLEACACTFSASPTQRSRRRRCEAPAGSLWASSNRKSSQGHGWKDFA